MGLRAVQRDVRIVPNGFGFDPKFLASELAKTAKEELAKAQASGAAPRSYAKYVNGREGVDEEKVILPGPIVYQFEWLTEVARYALTFARARSPVASGRFSRSWFLMVDGAEVKSINQIPVGSEIIITNDQPYVRKIEVGAMRMRVPPGIVEDMRQAVQRRFGNTVIARKTFIDLAGGYILRRPPKKGQALTYPALVVVARTF